MVIREYASCDECGTVHTLRIGIGAEPIQKHLFGCNNCGLEMGITLAMGEGWVFGPNAIKSAPCDKAPIVNLHPNFVFNKSDINSEKAFPSLEQGAKMIMAALAARRLAGLSEDFEPQYLPKITEEWDALRKVWSLTRNDKLELAEERMGKFFATKSHPSPPDSLVDWLFQFAGRLVQPAFETHFEALIEQLEKAEKNDDFERFKVYYSENMTISHGLRYLELLRSYLSVFSELSQVHLAVSSGIEITNSHAAASSDFDSTSMLYGNCFEAFSSNVAVLALLNNLIAGRRFDEFDRLTLDAYFKLDKGSRFGPFASNSAFCAICAEADNGLRNASHHGGLIFDRPAGQITYRAGKGGQGDKRTISYALYLAKCSKLLIQSMLIFRLEILLAYRFRLRVPL